MIPRAISAALRLPQLTDETFQPTQWASAEDKAKFGNHFLSFIAEDFPPSLWKKPFYRQLSNTFLHIAENNIHGFWETWFTTTHQQIEFLDNIAQYWCPGDAAWTFCDVERTVKLRVRGSGVLDWKRRVLRDEIKRRDLTELARLRRLYEPVSFPGALNTASDSPALIPETQRQADLFGAPTD